MKKHHGSLKAILAGLCVGSFLQSCDSKHPSEIPFPKEVQEKVEKLSPLAQSFYFSLDETHRELFLELDLKHQQMALEMCQQGCFGKNACRGLGGCKTNQHACHGLNRCKGQGGAPISDPNLCVEIQHEHQNDS